MKGIFVLPDEDEIVGVIAAGAAGRNFEIDASKASVEVGAGAAFEEGGKMLDRSGITGFGITGAGAEGRRLLLARAARRSLLFN